jgi:oxygen-dependent protoporphyrinogen oxidase
VTVAVVGSGIAGLAAAWELRRSGIEVVVLEREPRLGGKIRTVRREGFVFEVGAESFLATKPEALALCRELGLEAELVVARPGPVYVWARGALHSLPRETRLLPTRIGPLLESGLLTGPEKARAALDLVLPGAATGEDESLGRLVGRRMGRAAVDRIAGPLLAGIHAADPDRLSVAATFPALQEAERSHGSLLRGLRARGARGRVGSPFITLASGLETLVSRIAEVLGGAIQTSAEVTAIEPAPHGWRITAGDGSTLEAEGLVLTVPSWVAGPLLAPHSARAAELLESIEWVSTVVVTLAYREADAPPLAGHGFVVARDQRARITGCTWVSSKWPGRAPAGHVLLRAYLGHALDPVDLGADDTELAKLARDDLARAMGLGAEPVLMDVTRWPRAMPQLVVGHLGRIAEAERHLARLPRLALAGPGVGIADAVARGRRAARSAALGVEQGFLQPDEGSRF